MKTENITGKSGANVTPEKYSAIREAMLEILPADGEGLTLDQMVTRIEPKVPKHLFPKGVSWYTVTVKLDLEAKGLVKRLPGSKPLRHLKVMNP